MGAAVIGNVEFMRTATADSPRGAWWHSMEGHRMAQGNWWRALIVVAVLIGLPALAMPRVSNSINDWLYGDSKKIVPPMPELEMQAADSASEADAHASAKELLTADYQEEIEPREKNSYIARTGFDRDVPREDVGAPPLLNAPDEDRAVAEEPLEPLVRPGNPDSLARVREIKDQLASWGADYILLEAMDQGSKFRFCCLMADQADPQKTFPFESTAPDAAVAAESVLSAVKTWRQQARLK
jgi:hypothetical protein